MPLPVIAGLPWLAGILGAIFVKVIDFFTDVVTRRIAVKVSFALGVIALLGIFVGVIESLVSGLLLAVPPEIGSVIYWVLPSNLSYCVSAIITAKIARWVFEWHVRLLAESLPG